MARSDHCRHLGCCRRFQLTLPRFLITCDSLHLPPLFTNNSSRLSRALPRIGAYACRRQHQPNHFAAPSTMDEKVGRQMMKTLEHVSFPTSACRINCDNRLPQWSKALDTIAEKLAESGTFKRQFTALTSNQERVQLCLSNSIITESIEAYLVKFEHAKRCDCGLKDAFKAAFIRVQGNQYFGKEQFLNAFVAYTTALMYAPENDEAALLFGNRSTAYYHLEQFENALEDIDRALALGYEQQKPVGKLLLRKAECLMPLGRVAEAKDLLKRQHSKAAALKEKDQARWSDLLSFDVLNPIASVNLAKFQDVSTVIEFLTEQGAFSPNKKYPWLSSKVDLRFDPARGHYLVATAPITYEEIIALEKPFAGVALEEAEAKYVCCHHCSSSCYMGATFMNNEEMAYVVHNRPYPPARIFAPVPCTHCSSVLFCSENCRTSAWQIYHQFECAQLPLLHRIGDQARLALRMLYTVGDLEEIKKVLATGPSTGQLDISDPNKYDLLCQTMQAAAGENYREAMRNAITACLLVKLVSTSGFIQDMSPDQKELCGAILLQHMSQLKANRCLRLNNRLQINSDDEDFFYFSVASGVRSLMKKSCAGKVIPTYLTYTNLVQTNVIGWTALCDITPGTELDANISTNRDKKLLLNQACPCPSCSRRGLYPIGCSSCRSLMVCSAEADGSFVCSSCAHQMSSSQIRDIFNKVTVLADQAKRFEELSSELAELHGLGIDHPGGDTMVEHEKTLQAIEPLVFPNSKFLANLYESFLKSCGMLIATELDSPHVNMAHFETFFKYSDKQQAILEEQAGGVGKNSLDVCRLLMTNMQFYKVARMRKDPKLNALLRPRIRAAEERLDSIKAYVPFERYITARYD